LRKARPVQPQASNPPSGGRIDGAGDDGRTQGAESRGDESGDNAPQTTSSAKKGASRHRRKVGGKTEIAEAWLMKMMGQAGTHGAEGGEGAGSNLASLAFNREALLGHGLGHEAVDRLFRAMYVYTIGFHETVEEVARPPPTERGGGDNATLIGSILLAWNKVSEGLQTEDFSSDISAVMQQNEAAKSTISALRAELEAAAGAASGLRADVGARDRRIVSRPFPSWNRSILTEIHLCHACSCQEILRVETARQEEQRQTLRDAMVAQASADEQLKAASAVERGMQEEIERQQALLEEGKVEESRLYAKIRAQQEEIERQDGEIKEGGVALVQEQRDKKMKLAMAKADAEERAGALEEQLRAAAGRARQDAAAVQARQRELGEATAVSERASGAQC
jgi:hypothetical protein